MNTYRIYQNASKPMTITGKQLTEGFHLKVQDTIIRIAYKVIGQDDVSKTYTVCTPELREDT